MQSTARWGACLLSALLAGAVLPAQGQTGARIGLQAGGQTGAQSGVQAAAQAPTPVTPQAGAPTPQQAQKAQENRSDAEAYLQRAEAAATGGQTRRTDRINRDAGVPDEASGASGGGIARSGGAAVGPSNDRNAPPPYGPELKPRQPQATGATRRNPAEVHDETDSGANPAAQPQSQSGQRNPQARRPAWQSATDPMAPRPLRQEHATAANPEPLTAPAAAPQPVVPSTAALNGCQGASCTDAAGNRINGVGGSGAAGVSASGRLCNRSGATVQCF